MRRAAVTVLAIAVFTGWSVPARASASPDSTFSLVVYAGGGYSVYITEISPPAFIPSTVRRGGLSGSVRVMWHPDHLLRVGIESGWTRFFSYTLHGRRDGNLVLSSVPLLLVFSMPVGERFNVFVGAGGYFVSSTLDFETVVSVQEFSQGWMVAGSYTIPFSPRWSLATELKWLNASQFEDATLTAQVQLVWKFLEW